MGTYNPNNIMSIERPLPSAKPVAHRKRCRRKRPMRSSALSTSRPALSSLSGCCAAPQPPLGRCRRTRHCAPLCACATCAPASVLLCGSIRARKVAALLIFRMRWRVISCRCAQAHASAGGKAKGADSSRVSSVLSAAVEAIGTLLSMHDAELAAELRREASPSTVPPPPPPPPPPPNWSSNRSSNWSSNRNRSCRYLVLVLVLGSTLRIRRTRRCRPGGRRR